MEPIRTLDEVEKEHILKAMELTGGIRSQAAELLGIGFHSLCRRLKKYGIAHGRRGRPPLKKEPIDAG